MSDAEVGTDGADEVAMHAIAEAMRDAAATASQHAATATGKDVGAKALETVSRVVYTGSYVLAYGVVYAAVFVAQSLPQENPVMRGLRDGGRAAIDEASAI